MEKIKKMNVSLLTGENSRYKKIKIKENESSVKVNYFKLNINKNNIIYKILYLY
jgi:uncharacterized protein YggU (UPF0235/DUF167 family)